MPPENLAPLQLILPLPLPLLLLLLPLEFCYLLQIGYLALVSRAK